MKYILCLMVVIGIISCSSVDKSYVASHGFRMPPENPTREWVIKTIKEARDSHVINRGKYWDPIFDDWCVLRYDAVLKWIYENTEDDCIREIYRANQEAEDRMLRR